MVRKRMGSSSEILLVEDNPRDIRLIREAFNECIDLDQFTKIIKPIEDFWLSIVKLPTGTMT